MQGKMRIVPFSPSYQLETIKMDAKRIVLKIVGRQA